MLLSMDLGSGITINTSAHIENNLTINGTLIVGTTDILSAIADLQNNPSASSNVVLTNYYNKTESDTRYYTKSQSDTNAGNYVLKTGSVMTGDLTTGGGIQSRDLIATRELHADGAAILNSTLTVGGVLTANNTVNIKNAVTISGGRGTNNTGAHLKIIGTGDFVCNPSALSFGGSSTESHVFELSWLGMAHFMRLTAGSTTWSQTMLIEPSTGRWKFYLGLNVIGTVYGTAFSSTSDSRLKTNIEEIPEQDAIN